MLRNRLIKKGFEQLKISNETSSSVPLLIQPMGMRLSSHPSPNRCPQPRLFLPYFVFLAHSSQLSTSPTLIRQAFVPHERFHPICNEFHFRDVLFDSFFYRTLWNLDICVALLPELKQMFSSKYERFGLLHSLMPSSFERSLE